MTAANLFFPSDPKELAELAAALESLGLHDGADEVMDRLDEIDDIPPCSPDCELCCE